MYVCILYLVIVFELLYIGLIWHQLLYATPDSWADLSHMNNINLSIYIIYKLFTENYIYSKLYFFA